MKIEPIRTRLFVEGDDLAAFVAEHLTLSEGSVLVVTSKIVSLAEGRVVHVSDTEQALALMKQESDLAVQTPYTWMTMRQGMAMPRAGFDESKTKGHIVLLPKDCYASAAALHKALCQRFGIKRLGILISDSRTMPLRRGSIGICMGFAGIEPLKDYGQTQDMLGAIKRQRLANVVDALTAAAVHTMGESDQMQPLALISDADVVFTDKAASRDDIQIGVEQDLYGPLFEEARKKGKSKDAKGV